MEGVGFTIHYEMIWDVWSQLVGVMQSQLGSHTTAYNILAFVPVVFVFDAVRNQRKTVAAVAQMTAVQQRNDVVQVQRPRTPSKTVPRPSEQLLAPPPAGGSADGNAAAAGRESTSKAPPIRRASTESLVDEDKKLLAEASTLDQLWFMLGVGNVAITAYVLGLSPTWYYAYYTPKVISLTFLRWITFVKKKQHYLLYDFCYWVNALCLLYCWVYPHSQLMFRVLFINACGPLAIAVLCFNHSLIFHSYAHMTSVVIHVSPLVLVYGLRWHSDARFNICEDFPTCDDVSHLQLIDEAMRYFYLPWSGLYFLWIFVALGRYLEEKNYQTLWDRVLGTGAVGKFLRLMLTALRAGDLPGDPLGLLRGGHGVRHPDVSPPAGEFCLVGHHLWRRGLQRLPVLPAGPGAAVRKSHPGAQRGRHHHLQEPQTAPVRVDGIADGSGPRGHSGAGEEKRKLMLTHAAQRKRNVSAVQLEKETSGDTCTG
ncbi:unnamed protein product [Amoebophrya sp. A120]|nr:unnamed protein product [Amoebophrya sp. A120]|eukprot:GSA120T00002951001.1